MTTAGIIYPQAAGNFFLDNVMITKKACNLQTLLSIYLIIVSRTADRRNAIWHLLACKE